MSKKGAPREEQRRQCQGCNFHFRISLLFKVRDKSLCDKCGKDEIARWNAEVKLVDEAFKSVMS